MESSNPQEAETPSFTNKRNLAATQLTENQRTTIRTVLNNTAESPLSDLSNTLPDARAHLADHQIHRKNIDSMCTEVAENWPDVQIIECGVHCDRYPYIAIRITPYDNESEKRHDALVARLRILMPQTVSVPFLCLGEDGPNAINAATQLFKRQNFNLGDD